MNRTSLRARVAPLSAAALVTAAITAAFTAALTAGGCGELGEADAEPSVLTTISGGLSDLGDLEVEGELRVALIWRNGSAEYVPGEGPPYHIAHDVPVSTELPARFTLELTEPPPAIALREITAETSDTDFPPGSSYAVGALVVYDDRDGDGALDLLDAGSSAEVDRLVGARGDLEVWYVTGGVPRTAGQDGGGQYDFLQLGYQVVEWDGEEGHLLDDVDIPLVVEEHLRTIVCADPFGAPFQVRMHDAADQPDVYPTDPVTDRFECSPDGLWFEWDRTGCKAVHWDTLCPTDEVCPLDAYWVPDAASPPDGWPCEVTWTEP